MKVIKAVDTIQSKIGRFILIYGDMGVGKTCSALQSLWGKTCAILIEPRDIKLNIEASGRNIEDIGIAEYEDFQDMREFIADTNNFKDYDNILFDSLSHSLLLVGREISKNDFDAKYSKELGNEGGRGNIDKALAKEMKMSLEDFGAMAESGIEIIRLLGLLVRMGKTVVCTARIDEPDIVRQNMGQTIAPLFKGKMFGQDMAGWFDLIGLVEPAVTYKEDKASDSTPIREDGKKLGDKPVYKSRIPMVSFDIKNRALSKYTGLPPNGKGWNNLSLNFKAICNIEDKKLTETTTK